MNLNIAICDDDTNVIEDIKNKLLAYRNDYQIDTFDSGIKLLKNQTQYDLIFLDIEMPEMNGMDVALKLRKINFKGHLVFLTSHTEFMPEAFKVKAFRFLKKPINDDDFEETIVESEKEILNNKKLVIHSTDGIKLLYLNDIIYIIDKPWAKDANGNNLNTFYTIDGNNIYQTVDFDKNTAFPVVADPSVWQVTKCVGSIAWVIGTTIFAATKLVKIKKYIKELGGIKETAQLLIGATSITGVCETFSVKE